MGYTASVNIMSNAIIALAKALNDVGYRVRVSDAMEAFLNGVYA
jgi:hypothetical protein